jgi:dTDP-4-dehydrorhamnose 3,5-epimerase
MIKDVIVTDLDVINTPGGNVLHAIKRTDDGYNGFGEVYFSQIKFDVIKAWKKHDRMTLNIVVPLGKIRLVMFDGRNALDSRFQEIVISHDNYCRVTIPPKIWVGFQGMAAESMLVNIANIEHDPLEVERKNIKQIDFNWR